MASLAVMQRQAERFARRLGVDCPVRVQWAGACGGRLGPNTDAHCHVGGERRGTICVRRGLDSKWAKTIMGHEVAHLVVRGHQAKGFLAALARALPGDVQVQRQARATGAVAHAHRWQPYAVRPGRAPTGQALIQERCTGCWRTRDAAYRRVGPAPA